MRVGDICTHEVATIDRGASLVEAARRMRDEHIGSLVVVSTVNERRVPVAVLTDRDIVVGVLATDPQDLPRLDVGDVTGSELVTASEDEALETVLRRMRAFAVRRVPVLDRQGELAGILSLDDILDVLAKDMTEIAHLVATQRLVERVQRPAVEVARGAPAVRARPT